MKCGFAVCILAAMLALPAWADSFDDFNQGVNALNRSDNDRAILLLTRAIASEGLPKNLLPTALLDRATAYARKGLVADALPDLNVALSLNPGSYDTIYLRMQTYALLHQGQLAAADCDALIKLRPPVSAFYAECGVVRWENGEFAQSIPYFTTAVGLDAKPNPDIVLWLEIARERAGVPNEPQFAEIATRLNLERWPAPLFDLFLGKISPDAALAAAEQNLSRASTAGDSQAAALRTRRCQANFFVGEWQFLHKSPSAAQALLQQAVTYCADWLPTKIEVKRVMQQ